jgi:uncharacterized membrane protein YvbJ
MALIECDECGREISDKAATCPNCGNPVTENDRPALPPKIHVVTRTQNQAGCGTIFLAIVAAFLFIFIGIPIIIFLLALIGVGVAGAA